MKQDRVLFFKDVFELIPFSRTTLWRLERKGRFPRRHAFSGRVGWLESEVQDWIQASLRHEGRRK